MLKNQDARCSGIYKIGKIELEVDDGEFVESKSFDHILDVFNKRGKK
jgi:NADPH-dependent 7-cyano-7-deazaguanine reductase QueF-like protein